MPFVMNKNMGLSAVIYNTIMIDRGWDNEEIPLLCTIPERDRLDIKNELIHKDFGAVINQNYFSNGIPNNVLRDIDYKKLGWEWQENPEKYDTYLMETLHPRIIEYLILHDIEIVVISIHDSLDSVLKTSAIDSYLLTKTEIKHL